MANAVWPISLPQALLVRGLNGQPESGVVRTAMSVGPAKVRARTSTPIDTYTGELILTQAQLVTFWTFFNDTLELGALPFDWVHPRTAAAGTAFRFMAPPAETPLAPRNASHTEKWRVSFRLEVIPAASDTVEDGGDGDSGEALWGGTSFGSSDFAGEAELAEVLGLTGYPEIADDYTEAPPDEDDIPPVNSGSSMWAGIFEQFNRGDDDATNTQAFLDQAGSGLNQHGGGATGGGGFATF